MITLEFEKKNGIALLRPKGKLRKEDFESLASQVDPFIEKHGSLAGLIIRAEKFPGWEDFAALVAHLKFVNGHHKDIKKVAIVSDSRVMPVVPKLANHFVSAEVKPFEYDELAEARSWVLKGQ